MPEKLTIVQGSPGPGAIRSRPCASSGRLAGASSSTFVHLHSLRIRRCEGCRVHDRRECVIRDDDFPELWSGSARRA